MYICDIFCVRLQLQNGVAAVNDNLKVSLLSKLIPLSKCQLQQVNIHILKTVGDEGYYKQNWQETGPSGQQVLS